MDMRSANFPDAHPIISLANLSVGYQKKTVARVPSLQVERGQSLLLTGASGSGKSTLLFTIGGLLKPLAGNVVFDGHDFSQLSTGKIGRLRGERIGFIFQDVHLLAGLSVLDNVVLGAFAVGKRQERDRAVELLQIVGLQDLQHRKAETLSRGEAQRVAIARAMLLQPKLILADEPTASLDDQNTEIVGTLLVEAAKHTDAALLIATHDQRLKLRFVDHLELSNNPIAGSTQ